MSSLKPIFIGLLIPILLIIASMNLFGFYRDGFILSWVALTIANLPFLLFLIQITLLKNMTQVNPHMPLISATSVIGSIIGIYAYLNTQTTDSVLLYPLVLTLLTATLFFLYTYWFSSFNRLPRKQLEKGNQLPEFNLSKGAANINSRQFIGKPAVIIFYRGSWCPFCVAQIKEVVSRYKQAIYGGVQFILISPQPDRVTQKLAAKFDVPFMFLNDENNNAAKTLGIVDRNGLPIGLSQHGIDNNTVYPTVIVTDKRGTILYSDQTDDYRFRPDASEYLSLLITPSSGS